MGEKWNPQETATIEALGISGRTVNIVRPSENELRILYQSCAVLVYPSFYEGFGIPPIEAFACGCPALVSNIASLPEVCQDAALYCDPFSESDIADKIVTIVTDENLRSQLIEKGKLRAAEFSCSAVAKKTVKVINDLVLNGN